MHPMPRDELTRLYLNIGHLVDHLMMLIFPTVVIAIGRDLGRPYGELLPLALGGFIAFGAFSIPAGWLADRWSRRGMMVVFFIGIGAATALTGLASNDWQIALGLTLVGMFAAIYHPVGIAMLVAGQPAVGRLLGVNGVWGNMGLAFSALTAGALADLIHWRAAFIVPGVLSILLGLAFLRIDPPPASGARSQGAAAVRLPRALLARVFAVLCVTVAAGGIVFNATLVSMPKVFDERLSALTDSTLGIGVLVCVVYMIAAVAQLVVGRLIDTWSLKGVFVPVAIMQVPLLAVAAYASDWAMLAVAVAMMFFVFGQIPINDAMIARYTADEWRARAYSVRYLVSFGASATAVPLVAYLHTSTGDFQAMYGVLALIGVATALAAIAFPGDRAVAQPATPA